MNSRACSFRCAAALILVSAATAPAVTVLYDFGLGNNLTPAPTNNLSALAGFLNDSTDTAGSVTGIKLASTGWVGANGTGTTSPTGVFGGAGFGSSATSDSFYGDNSVPTSIITFSGLDGTGATSYTFDIFASRAGVADNRSARYTLTGLTSGSAALDASNNTSNFVTVSMIPSASGVISLTSAKDAANTNGTGLYYLGAVRLTTVPVPEPSAAGMLILTAAAALGRRRPVR